MTVTYLCTGTLRYSGLKQGMQLLDVILNIQCAIGLKLFVTVFFKKIRNAHQRIHFEEDIFIYFHHNFSPFWT